jgi:glycosyltransferase involved in cell wall biosynthesis
MSLVSAIIPVFNGERFLAQAISSVLDQSYGELEVLVVDDGSSDGSFRLASELAARQPRIRVLGQAHGGPGAARNLGVLQASGDLFAFLDADDLWTPDKLKLQMAHLREHPEVEAVFGLARQFHSPELTPEQAQKIRCPEKAQPGMVAGTLLIRRASFQRVGLFAETWQVGEFVDWYCRAQEAGLRSELLPQLVLLRRLHGQNLGVLQPNHKDFATILLNSLRRRRQSHS